MSLEVTCRRLLRAYPRAWRDAHEEEVLGVLLDAAEVRGARRPALADAVDVLGHGLLVRARLTGGAPDGRARELTAVLALASLTALSAVFLLFGEWWPWPTRTALEPGWSVADHPGSPGPFLTAGGPLMPVLLGPAVLVLLRRPRAARHLLGALLPVLVLLPVAARLLGLDRPALWALTALLGLSALSLLAPVRRRTLLVVITAAIATAAAWSVFSGTASGEDPRPFFYYGSQLSVLSSSVPLVVLATVAVAAGLRAVLPAAAVGAMWLVAFALRLRSTLDGPGVLYLLTATALATLAVQHVVMRRSSGSGHADQPLPN